MTTLDPTTVHRLPIATETLAESGQTNTYLIEGSEPLLLDPAGRDSTIDSAIETCRPAHITATHCHPDHIAGVSAYAFETNATVWSCIGHENRFAQSTGVYPARTFSDGDTVGPARVIETPGHAVDHTAFEVDLEDGRRAIFCGDLVVADGSVVVGGPDADMAAYIDSLSWLRAREPDLLYPGHGPVINEPDAEIDRLIAHRQNREKRILEALSAGAEEIREIVDRAYDKDISSVYSLAEKTVIAHVEKLASEGRVRWDCETEQVTRLER